MKKNFVLFFLFMTMFSNCQVTKSITFKAIESDLITFLNKQKDIRDSEVNEFKNGKFGLFFSGVYNEKFSGNLIDGVYTFSAMRTNTHVYFLIVENNQICILNIASRKGLDESITKLIDFAERKRYCSTITGDLVSKIIETYNRRNRDINVANDVNCEKGVVDIKDLP